MKKSVLFLFLTSIIIGLASCGKEEKNPPVVSEELENILTLIACIPPLHTGQPGDITGKWMLVQSSYGIDNREQDDRSCERIIYEFLPDGKLVVMASESHHLNGQYNYDYHPLSTKTNQLRLTPAPNLKIDGWNCYGRTFEQYLTIVEGDQRLWNETFLRIN